MEKEKLNNQNKLPKEGYIIIPNSFFKEWVGVLGDGPTLLYLKLLTYCHKDKDTAWPTLKTLSRHLYKSTKSLTRHHRRLAKVGLIKKVVKSKTASGNYKRNIYQLTIPDREKNSLPIGNFVSYVGDKTTPNLGTKCPLNNNNLNNTNTTTTKRKKDAAVVVVDFKKSKEKGEEKMQAIREQLIDLDFKAGFIEQLLKDFDSKKIEEKLDLLLARKNIQNPAGWLRAALKHDYQSSEQEERDEREEDKERGKIGHKKASQKKEASSREKALEMIKKTRKMLDNLPNKEEI